MSNAKNSWSTSGAGRLDQLERIHADSRGYGRGRRWYTGELNRSLLVTLVGQFQVYCRDLHDEAIGVYLSEASEHQREVLQTLLKQGRKLDTQTPRRSALGSDFGRLGFDVIPALNAQGDRVVKDLRRLDQLIEIRNAIVHGNETRVQSLVQCYQTRLTLYTYRQYRKTLDRLVWKLDTVVALELAAGLQIPQPW